MFQSVSKNIKLASKTLRVLAQNRNCKMQIANRKEWTAYGKIYGRMCGVFAKGKGSFEGKHLVRG